MTGGDSYFNNPRTNPFSQPRSFPRPSQYPRSSFPSATSKKHQNLKLI